MKLTPFKCEVCGGENFDKEELKPNKNYINKFINLDSLKSPPQINNNTIITPISYQIRVDMSCRKSVESPF